METFVRKYYRVLGEGREGRGDPRGLAVARVTGNGQVAVGFALCSNTDNFDRNRANLIALGRLYSGKFTFPVEHIDAIPDAIDPAFYPMSDDIIWAAKSAFERFTKRNANSKVPQT